MDQNCVAHQHHEEFASNMHSRTLLLAKYDHQLNVFFVRDMLRAGFRDVAQIEADG